MGPKSSDRRWLSRTLLGLGLLVALAFGQGVHSQGLFAPARPSFEVTGFKVGHDAGRLRLVVELSGQGRLPYDVSFDGQDNSVVIDLRDTSAAVRSLPASAGDPLVTSWRLVQPNFQQLVWRVNLAWPVPSDHVQASLLSNPTRLVVDVRRDFQEELELAVTRGVQWRRSESRTASGYTLLNELEVAWGRPEVSLSLIHASDSLKATERPRDMASRKGPLALVNGGFFAHAGGPLGLIVEQGRVLSPPVATRPPRTCLGLTRAGRVIFGRVQVKDGRLASLDGGDWSDVVLAIGGGPRLVQGGRVHLTTDEEGLGPKGNNITRAAGRTAVAVLRNGRLLLVTVSGYRDNHREGWKLPDLAAWLVRRGAVDAMGLDGGGSTAMVIQGQTVSRSSANKYERKVANALALYDSSPVMLPAAVSVVVADHQVPADGATQVKVVAVVGGANGRPVADGTPVFFATTRGTIVARSQTRGGRASATWTSARQPGESRVFAFAGMAWGEDRISLEAGPPARLLTRVQDAAPAPLPSASPGASGTVPGPVPTPSMARRSIVEVLVTDAWFNPLPDQEVRLQSAPALETKGRTGGDGLARFVLEGATETALVRHSDLAPVQVRLP